MNANHRVERCVEQIDEILGEYKSLLGAEFTGYRNHVCRMVNFALGQGDFDPGERDKIVIAGCFHDLGIWTHRTFDYIPPSIELATDFLERERLSSMAGDVREMIEEHHRVRAVETNRLVESFRRGDLVDVTLGAVTFDLSREYISDLKASFPNAGFHAFLVRLAFRWFCRHPFRPVPVLKW